MLSKEFIDDKEYDMALAFIDRMDRNWSRDLILGDKIGFYHVSWREQIWIRRAEVYMYTNKSEEFDRTIQKIIQSRLDFFMEAVRITGETIIGDRCTYSTYKLMACQRKKLNEMTRAINFMKKALYYKSNTLNITWQEYNDRTADELQDNKQKLYDLYSQMYYRLSNNSYDDIHYGYCASCTNFMAEEGRCSLHNTSVDIHKACSQFRH
jgi:RNA polymerase-binding transcription factor DksA